MAEQLNGMVPDWFSLYALHYYQSFMFPLQWTKIQKDFSHELSFRNVPVRAAMFYKGQRKTSLLHGEAST
jgi:hypothetical protein